MVPEKYAVNHIDKQSNEDFINCEFHLAESLKMKKQGSLLEFLLYCFIGLIFDILYHHTEIYLSYFQVVTRILNTY